jgi:hypothetical protein
MTLSNDLGVVKLFSQLSDTWELHAKHGYQGASLRLVQGTRLV